MDPKSVAVGGIGYDPLAIATDGFIANESGAITLVQTAGIAPSNAFSMSTVLLGLGLAGLASSEAFGSNVATLTVGTVGINSTGAFGAVNAETVLNSLPLGSDEAFGSDSIRVTAHTLGFASEGAFGSSVASYDNSLTQHTGIPSAEAFGVSMVVGLSNNGADDYTNDAAVLAAKKRPLWLKRRGGSSSTGSSTSWNITVVVEMLQRDGVTSESLDDEVKGAVTKTVKNDDRITVQARLHDIGLHETIVEKVTVHGQLLHVGAVEKPTMVVSAQKVVKVA